MLLQRRRYELRFGEEGFGDSSSIPASWEGLLKPGDRISMNAVVEKPKDETVIVCPACLTWIADRSGDEESAGWMKWCEVSQVRQQQSLSLNL